MRRGADNFLQKPINFPQLELFLGKSLELGSLRRFSRVQHVISKSKEPYFGVSPVMRSVADLAALAANIDHPALLTGETGTGKGVLARWIHDRSGRREAAFVEVNCSTLRGELLASELFGHAKGAFTSALRDREGLLDGADGGTLFLDEIGDMDIGIQAQFLKVIEEKAYRRLGEVRIRKSNFRLICATNKNLLQASDAGSFRKDLYDRIQVLPIQIPSLMEYAEDLAGLVQHILSGQHPANVSTISERALSLIKAYSWPGNIRELNNVLERAVLLSQGSTIEVEHLPGLEPEKPGRLLGKARTKRKKKLGAPHTPNSKSEIRHVSDFGHSPR